MIVECPVCKAENPFRIKKCSRCGYSFVEEMEAELKNREAQVAYMPEMAGVWIEYAYALLRNGRKAEAMNALDKALPLLAGDSLTEYRMAAGLYATAERAEFAQRLLADGLLYNLDNFRDRLEPEEIEAAGAQLRAIADVVWKQNAMIGQSTKNSISAGIADAVGLGTYQLAEKLASPPNQRLYPGAAVATTKSSSDHQLQMNRGLMRFGIIALVFLLLFACVLSQCAAS
jgi:tetratricopeptide (TPR) repeat protein